MLEKTQTEQTELKTKVSEGRKRHTPRMVAFRPGQSPPEVRIPTRFFIQKPSFIWYSAPRVLPFKVSLPGDLPVYSIRLFRMGAAVKRSAENLHASTVHFCGQENSGKTFAEKIKKWLTSAGLLSIISLVSSARRGRRTE